MKWGEYLCYGTTKLTEKENDRARLVINKLEKVFQNMGLTPFSTKIIMQFIKSKLQCGQGSKISRVMAYLLQLLHPVQVAKAREQSEQKGCPQLIPGLRTNPYWNSSEFPWIDEVQQQFHNIRGEFLNMRNHSNNGFQHYRSPHQANSTDKGEWNVCYLFLHDVDFKENHEKCPITVQAIKNIPKQYNHAFFSAMAPNTHILPHYGPTNKKLRCFLPLFVPEQEGGSEDEDQKSSAWITVHGERHNLQEGQCFVFDDSFYHEAGNDNTNHPRIVLIFDVWHPDLTAEEIKILEFLNKAQITAMKRMEKAREAAAQSPTLQSQPAVESASNETVEVEETFYSAILASHAEGIHEASAIANIWGEYQQDV